MLTPALIRVVNDELIHREKTGHRVRELDFRELGYGLVVVVLANANFSSAEGNRYTVLVYRLGETRDEEPRLVGEGNRGYLPAED